MKRKPTKRVGQQIIESLQEAVEALRTGAPIEELFRCRRVEVEEVSIAHDPTSIKQTRELLAATPIVFAQLLGVSVQTVRAWEQGENVPSGIARRFMDEIRHDPEYWRKRLREVVVPKREKTA